MSLRTDEIPIDRTGLFGHDWPMVALLLKIFAFYMLFIAFKAILAPLIKGPRASGKHPNSDSHPKSGGKNQGPQKGNNDDIIEAEYRVIKDK